MPDGYDSHADYMQWVRDDAVARKTEVRDALLTAFAAFVELREVDVINFSSMSAFDLAKAIEDHPLILKVVMACCNVAGRAIERDLDIRNVNTYEPRLTSDQSKVIAGYLKPFLPQELAIPALTELDRHFFVDKQIRARKGQWEKKIAESLNKQSKLSFKKRQFECEGESFELDAATPAKGAIRIGVDVKRIEARRDIHKRCDEIVNKAAKLKKAHPKAKFVAVVYYPFTAEQVNVRQRLESPDIDEVVFASKSSEQLETAIGLLVDKLTIRGKPTGKAK